MERQPCGTNGDSKSRRIFYKNTEELGTDDKGNGGSLEKHEETIRQEKIESSRTKGWRQCMAWKQEYLIISTLKEVGQQKIQTF